MRFCWRSLISIGEINPLDKPAYVTDLFTGKRSISTLSDAFYYQVKVPAYGGALLKFSFM